MTEAYYCVRVGGAVAVRDLTMAAAKAKAAELGGSAELDWGSPLFLEGMAAAAYGCGASLDGDSYAQSARESREARRRSDGRL